MPYIGNEVGNRFVASKSASVYSGNGSTTAFTLEHAVGSDEDILVSVDGVIQEPSVAYAVSSGTTLTFTAAPSSNSGNNIFVYYLFRTVATVDHPSTSALSATSGTFSASVSGTTGTFTGDLTSAGSVSSTDGGTALTMGVLSNATTLPALNFNGAFASSAMSGLYGNGVTASNLYYTVPSSKEHFFSIADSVKLTLGDDLTTTSDVNIIIQGTHNEGGGLLDLKGTDTPADAKTLGSISFGNSTDRSLAMIRGVSEASDAAGLRFYTETTGATIEERMKIDSTGIITKPYQPSFLVQPSTAQNNIGEGSQIVVAFGTERFDVGSNFASNTFTAPVTGKYLLNFALFVVDIDNAPSYFETYLVTSNRNYYNTIDPRGFDQDPTYWTFTNCVVADMDANDTSSIQFNIHNGGTVQSDIQTYSHFSGYLLG